MTGFTIFRQAQKCIFLFPYGNVLNVLRPMALFTFSRGVCSFKLVLGEVVIELFFVEPDHVEFSAVMFAMTCKAVFGSCFSA
ncbi:MAG: hypothetical protein C0490_09515 [Marivirga sp.]|nr:hypothetical protein [Marivirga sp.]